MPMLVYPGLAWTFSDSPRWLLSLDSDCPLQVVKDALLFRYVAVVKVLHAHTHTHQPASSPQLQPLLRRQEQTVSTCIVWELPAATL